MQRPIDFPGKVEPSAHNSSSIESVLKKKVVVVVGAGYAGQQVVSHLLKKGFPGEIVLLEKDPQSQIYPKDQLIKAFSGKVELSKPDEFTCWKNHPQVKFKPGHEMVHIDERRQTIKSRTAAFRYDYLVICTGAKAVDKLSTESYSMYSHQELLTLFKKLKAIEETKSSNEIRIAVIGNNWSGLEISSRLNEAGFQVKCIGKDLPLLGTVPQELSKALAEDYLKAGVNMVYAAIDQILTTADGLHSIYEGNQYLGEYDLAIEARGYIPFYEMYKTCKIPIGIQGVLVQEGFETQAHQVYAAGDVAQYGSQCWGNFKAIDQMAKAISKSITDKLLGASYYHGDSIEPYVTELNSSIVKLVLCLPERKALAKGKWEMISMGDGAAGIFRSTEGPMRKGFVLYQGAVSLKDEYLKKLNRL